MTDPVVRTPATTTGVDHHREAAVAVAVPAANPDK